MEQYQIIEEIGSGSFGNVLKVKNVSDGGIYAMKQIKIKQLSFKEKSNALNEIRLLASIESKNIIEYKGAFFDGNKNKLCMILEFAQGGDLADFIKKRKENKEIIKQQFIWKIAYDMLQGIKALHDNNIIHRDIKSGNVFLINGIAKLGDLNASKVLQGKFATTTTGTPFYISPQIWTGKKYGFKCDIWSFGCLLYELCMLKPPFLAHDFSSLIRKIKSGYYQPIPHSYSKKMSNLIRRCLTVDSMKRPSAEELLKIDIFKAIENQKGDHSQKLIVQLLEGIEFPNALSKLNINLPRKSYKKIATMKNMQELDNLNDYEQFAQKRVNYEKTKNFASQRFICQQEVVEIKNEQIQENKQDKQNKKINRKKLKIIQQLKIPLAVKKLRIRLVQKNQSKKKI